LGAVAVPVIVSCWGMWRNKSWSWGLAVVADSFGLVLFLWDPLARRVRPDIDEMVLILLFTVTLFSLLSRSVRRFFLRKKEAWWRQGPGYNEALGQ
jgi:uncharacterized membrane protein (DUF2068 family)